MRHREFFEFLVRTYRGPRFGRPLSAAAADDAVSRCRRVESALGDDLDQLLRRVPLETVLEYLDGGVRVARFHSNEGDGKKDLRSAVRKYASFVGKVTRPAWPTPWRRSRR